MEFQALHSQRLELTLPTEADAHQMFVLCQDPVIQKFVPPVGSNYTLERAELFISQIIPSGWESGRNFEWAIREKSDVTNSLVGMVSVSAAGDLGLWIGAPSRSKGYGKEAIAAVIEWAEALDLVSKPLSWVVLNDNFVSIKLAETLGFGFTEERQIPWFDGTNLDVFVGHKTSTASWPAVS